MQAYLSSLADSDLFGTLATISLMVAASGLFKKVRRSRLYFPVAFVCLLFMPALHAIGSYYLSQPSP
jgi:NhaP-type Na+/H+ or K+/H+ antiporter